MEQKKGLEMVKLIESTDGPLRTGTQCAAAPHFFADRAAGIDCPLLIHGATGTGKGYLARWIHQRSKRAAGALIPLNCGAIPESVIDSHLFGHAKGAFSGATGDHLGLVRAADGGTLLLDEISELPVSAQVRLLRLLEEREVQPVGYNRPIAVNVRVIAATSADLWQAVQSKCFREDLYFRLDFVKLALKPLRERLEEIEPLLEQFNREFAEIYGQPKLNFTDDAFSVLMGHEWPGNVRELRAVVERLHVLCGAEREVVGPEELHRFGQLPRGHWRSGGASPGLRVLDLKLEIVNQALQANRGNMSRAANALGVHRSTLYRWLAGNSPTTACA